MIKPALQDEEFLAEVRHARASPLEFQIWWLGQSGFLLHWNHRHLLFDPYLSDSLTRKYAGTDKPHVRMVERVISPERLDFIDLATSSHNHTDHLDAETLGPLLRVNPSLDLIIPEANREFVADRLKIPVELPIGLDDGRKTSAKGFVVHGVAAAHEAIDRDGQGRCRYLGYVVEFGAWTVYHSGDTVCHPDLAPSLRRWRIDLALLPINGSKPERRVAGNMNAREAAELGAAIGARCVIPCHFEMFEFNLGDPGEFIRCAHQLGLGHRVLAVGGHWNSRDLPES